MEIKALLLAFATLLSSVSGLCCSCFGKYRITVQDYNSYGWIFEGTLISERRTGSADYQYGRESLYKVVKSYKGLSTGDTVHIFDAEDNGACGLGRLRPGRNYLIYATGKDRKFTSDCSRTTRAPVQIWPQDSVAINKLKHLSSFGRIYDTLHTNFHADTSFLNKHLLLIGDARVRFYDEQGKLSAEGKYENGLPVGLWKYYENGKVVSKGKYAKGCKDSIWMEPFMDKSVYFREYKDGEFTYREKFFFDGRLSGKTEPIGNGEKWVEYVYHSNGKPRFIAYASLPKRNQKGELEKPSWNGPFKMFNRAGRILEEGVNDSAGATGRWKYHYEDSKLRMEGDYVGGSKIGIWKIYYPNGKVKASGAYLNDEKEGAWKFYDESGKEIPVNMDLIKEDEDWFTYSGVKN